MGKGKLGQRSRLFHDLPGDDFKPNQLLIMVIDTARSVPKAAIFLPRRKIYKSFFFTPDRPLKSYANQRKRSYRRLKSKNNLWDGNLRQLPQINR